MEGLSLVQDATAMIEHGGAAAQVGAPVVEARGLGLTFATADGPVQALTGLDLTISKGDFVSFIGPSGCGKTTFLRAIAALETPTEGTLTVNGMSPDAARRARAYGYVFQAAGLYPWRTIAGNVKLPLEIMGFSKAEQDERVRKVLELVDLDGFGNKFPWQLSGGMQQRASIARALAFDADILLMDEPFGALDEIVRDRLNEELLKLWNRTGKTIGFVTHSIPEAVYLSTRIVVMSPRPGRITDVIESPLPRERPLEIRDTPEFIAVAHRVREGLRAGHSYDV
jgi:NitT/TauT family transport system ATP-binding protein